MAESHHALDLRVSPEAAATPVLLRQAVARRMGLSPEAIGAVDVLRRSIDARKRPVKVQLRVAVQVEAEGASGDAASADHVPPDGGPVDGGVVLAGAVPERFLPDYPDVSEARPVLVVGAGPGGLFAALELIERGYKPIVLERGKAVRDRRRDLARLNREGIVNPDSNYCFGEGGAGTYSDGKLYTRSTKRGDVRKVLELLVAHGADPDILIDAHPHVGTNKLPGIIEAMRERILERGGEIHFGQRVVDLSFQNGRCAGVFTERVGENGNSGALQRWTAEATILATGHSARDIYRLLRDKGLALEAKPFALGVRVEHPQSLVDRIQYHLRPGEDRGPWLPPAPYKIVRQVAERGVYSFCMCPGGIIAPCATAPGEVVTNGWSPSKRDQPWANSGIVVELHPADYSAFAEEGPLAGMAFQAAVEQTCWEAGGRTQRVPAQRLTDFADGRASSAVGPSSYLPGTTPSEIGALLPEVVASRLREGFRAFGRSMRGYLTDQAVVHAPESRSSSPVRIPRDRDSWQHPQAPGLYPVGEGAGYAGGIVSAAVDGMRCVEALVQTKE